MITAVPGVRVGHWTAPGGRTGCTVVLLPDGTVASGEVRGGAPASREFALLEPHRTVVRLDALVLAGGSAFGLAAADGVMAWCAERGVGFATSAGSVPIVVGLAVFDLVEADGDERPHRDAGLAVCVAATDVPVQLGRVGAGAGCTVRKWRGPEDARPGGLGGAVIERDELVVAALLAVNAVGDLPVDGEVRVPAAPETAFAQNSTVGIVVTNGRVSKVDCLNAAQAGHDGLARALDPAHTGGDGDALVVAATGAVEADPATVRQLAAVVVDQAIRAALEPVAFAPVATALEVVAEEARTCTRCGLASGRTQVVFGRGDPDADLLFIGEGPGAEEDRLGEPFVGRSGQLLDRLIHEELGLSRDEVRVVNVVMCRPPGNRDPLPEEIEACSPYLSRQIELTAPRVIVTLGNFATRFVLQTKEGITKLRGRTHPHPSGATVVPTFHPAAVLRGGAESMAQMRADLVRAKLLLREGARR